MLGTNSEELNVILRRLVLYFLCHSTNMYFLVAVSCLC
uniref:Uncharacterized protein n=1 Tax=Arundo donax TaxID=35708 RepID=A0A0A8YGM8_ARUDO